MQLSVVISEWIEQGRQQGLLEARLEVLDRVTAILRDKLPRVLEQRFGGTLPEGLRQQIEAQTQLDVVDRWFDLALDATSLEQFRAGLPPQTNGTA